MLGELASPQVSAIGAELNPPLIAPNPSHGGTVRVSTRSLVTYPIRSGSVLGSCVVIEKLLRSKPRFLDSRQVLAQIATTFGCGNQRTKLSLLEGRSKRDEYENAPQSKSSTR